MATAVLKQENLGRFCPVTNLYECSDGFHLLVTVFESFDVGELIQATTGLKIPIARTHMPTGVEVFLSDEDGTVLDADGDPANGMTPIARFPAGDFESVLAALGYELA